MEEKNVEKVLDRYQAGNKAIRQRLLLLALFWVIIFGLFLIKQSETEKWNVSVESESVLKWMLDSPDTTLKKLDSLSFDDPMLLGLYSIGRYVDNWDTLSASFYQSNYRNKAPIKQALFELNRKRTTFFKDQTISFFGVQLTIDPWYYLGLLIILILLHDLTRVILYQKDLKSQLLSSNVQSWELGFEQMDYFGEAQSTSGKFIQVISSLLFGLILISPIAASVLSMQLKPIGSGPNMYLEILNSFLLFLIIIHTAIIFNSENIFGTKDLIYFLMSKDKKPGSEFYVFWSCFLALSLMFFIPWAIYYPEYPAVLIKAIFIVFMILCLSALPFGIWLGNKRPGNKLSSGIIFASIWLNCSWIVTFYQGETHYSSGIFKDHVKEFLWYLTIILVATFIYLRFLFPEKRD